MATIQAKVLSSNRSNSVSTVTIAINDEGEFNFSQFAGNTLQNSVIGFSFLKANQTVKTGVAGILTLTGYFMEDSPATKIGEYDLSTTSQNKFDGVYEKITAKLTSLSGADQVKITIIQQNTVASSGTGGDVK